jgi:hypothetical protein
MIKTNYKLILLILSTWIFISCETSSSSGSTATTPISTPVSTSADIDVLVLYDTSVLNAYTSVSTRVNHLFAVANNIYRDSYLDIRIHAKKILFYDAQTHPALTEIANSAKVQATRVKYKADTVLIYQLNPNGSYGQCGVAYGATSYAQHSQFSHAMFAQVEINCPVDTTAHEIGHNMGLHHSQLQNGSRVQPYPYGLGHGVKGKFATVMAYGHLYDTSNQISRFSSPEYDCIAGYPCGIPIGQRGEAHATKVMEVTAPLIANLY